MTAPEAMTPQKAAEASYRHAEREMRKAAKEALRIGDRPKAHDLLEIAHHVGMEFVRNHIGPDEDMWELPPTQVVT